jgi:hypothetical protein
MINNLGEYFMQWNRSLLIPYPKTVSAIIRRCWGVTAGLFLWGVSAILVTFPVDAAEKVVIISGIFRESIPVEELEAFAQTGEISPALRDMFNASNQDPEKTRTALTHEVPVNLIVLDKALNSWPGERFLDELSKVIHTRSDQANRQALRGAIILSASEDNQISMLEIIQNYPSPEVQVEADRLIEAAEKLDQFSKIISGILKNLKGL